MKTEEFLRGLPKIDDAMSSDEFKTLIEKRGRDIVLGTIRRVIEREREDILKGKKRGEPLSIPRLREKAELEIAGKLEPSIRHAVNATGIILHTGLGRAMMPEAAVEAVKDVMRGYCNLAIDMETGKRGHRDEHVSALLCELTGAEAATIVNNNAAATVLILNTLARRKEVIVSRGHLVEIGGAFRMPDVMKTSGTKMREVGTTNKTHLKDYSDAINEKTGAILRVHQSNYRIVGFSSEPSLEELVELAHDNGLPLVDDLGSGALVDTSKYGLEHEPLVQFSNQKGADVVCFSGDKLIGGPQAGIIVGKKDLIEKIKKNPLARALRIDKMTAAAMEATLKLFLNPEKLSETHPTYRMLSYDLNTLEKRAQKVLDKLNAKFPGIKIADGECMIGSGSVPTQTVPTKVIQIKSSKTSADSLARRLRSHKTPIFGRIQKDAVLLDFRTIQPDEDEIIIDALNELLKEEK